MSEDGAYFSRICTSQRKGWVLMVYGKGDKVNGRLSLCVSGEPIFSCEQDKEMLTQILRGDLYEL